MYNLLCETLLKGLREGREIPLHSTSKMDFSRESYNRGGNGDNRELMLNLGSQDGITTKDVVGYLASAQVLKGHAIGKIRVIKRRSFIFVPSKRGTFWFLRKRTPHK